MKQAIFAILTIALFTVAIEIIFDDTSTTTPGGIAITLPASDTPEEQQYAIACSDRIAKACGGKDLVGITITNGTSTCRANCLQNY